MKAGTSSSLSVSISPASTAFMLGRDCARLRSGAGCTIGSASTGDGPLPLASRCDVSIEPPRHSAGLPGRGQAPSVGAVRGHRALGELGERALHVGDLGQRAAIPLDVDVRLLDDVRRRATTRRHRRRILLRGLRRQIVGQRHLALRRRHPATRRDRAVRHRARVRLHRRRDVLRLRDRVEARRDHGDADLVGQVRIDDRAEDDLGVLVRGLLDQRRRLADLVQREVRAAGDVDEDRRSRPRSRRPRAAASRSPSRPLRSRASCRCRRRCP